MSKVSTVATYIVRKLWTVVAITLVVFALLMSLLRYSLPLLNDKKDVLEDFARSEYGVGLKIESIAASWQGVGPAIVLNNVTLEQSDNSPISLNIKSVYIEIDFWDSLLTQQISSKNFSLDGLLADLDLQRVQGDTNTDFPILDALEGLFLEQLQSFSLVNSVLTISGENNQQSFNIENLSWLNKDTRHQGSGLITVSELAANSAVFVIDLNGSADNFDGTIYAKADELDLSPWVNEFSALESELLEGRANFEFWAEINRRNITKVYGNIKPTRFIWQQENDTLSTGIESGVFVAEPRENKWLFNVKDLNLSVSDQQVLTQWSAAYSKGGEMLIQSDAAIELEIFKPISGLFSSSLAEQLRQIDTKAKLKRLQIQSRRNGVAAYALMKDITLLKKQEALGLNGLDAELAWQKNVGAVKFTGESVGLETGAYFKQNFSDVKVDLATQIFKRDEHWFIDANKAQLSVFDTDVNSSFTYNLSTRDLSLFSDIGTIPVSRISRFLPNEPLLGKNVSGFLNKAFYGQGRIAGGSVLWRGQLNAFPFKQNQGVFLAKVAIENADFSFDKSWPSISALDLDLVFENLELTMTGSSALIDAVQITEVNAYIPILNSGADLIIEANAKGSASSFAEVLANSSLREGIGKTLSNDIIVDKTMSADLAIYVPLDNPRQTSASGVIELANNTIDIPALKLKLEDTNGRLTFNNDKVYFKALNANLLGQPVSLDFNGGQQEENYRFDVNVSAKNWNLSSLVPYISDDLNTYLSGVADWEASVNVGLSGKDYDYVASVYSNTKGVSSILPAPFDKTLGEERELKLSANGNPQASTIKMNFGDMISFDGILPHREMQFSRAHLAIGETDFVGRGVGFSISANLPNIELSSWYQSVAALLSGANSSDNPLFAAPQRIFIETDALIIGGQSLSDVDATVKSQGKDWLVDLISEQAKAQITFHDRWLEEGIEVDAAFVRFDDWTEQEEKQGPQIEPQTLPRIRVKCADCRVLGNRLGRIDFESVPNDDGLRIERAIIEGPNGKISVNGQWYKRNQDHYTFISGTMNSKDFGGFLKDFQFDSGIKDSEAKMDFAATWKDSPFDFAFDYLDGEIDWELSDGYITELSDKGSRIFTLLSLDSLVRKLSLDFRDVFAEGFFYDEMQGSVQITEGKADTRDTTIDGGAGEMEIYGYTDLVSKELNYNVSFTPNVTGNLPVLVYFMVNPPTALAALALDQVLTSAKVISNVNYSVTGTIAEPVLIETGRESTEVELPARRDSLPEPEDDFVPPTSEDTLLMEVQDDS
ncbi:TIGR02099 family protein [Glaciecola sp. MH2013]|uniref:YhdP family protein n=1 Tax=Glaciecola sp. MH2013 TaxID=2785524 RepID=UPI0018A06954|nr:YhdP family protein [Glaciecola sp. MH2013]MBF7073708.1 TIGR02099 family protein [Glaciecola sp. MH2013]